MTPQLYTWEYEGKTEFGYKYEARFLTLMDPYLSKWRNEVTNLRPAKVVDEVCQDESHTFVNDTCKYCGQNIPITEIVGKFQPLRRSVLWRYEQYIKYRKEFFTNRIGGE